MSKLIKIDLERIIKITNHQSLSTTFPKLLKVNKKNKERDKRG